MILLRNGTRDEHRRLDERSGLLESTHSSYGYASALSMYRAFHQTFEPALSPFDEQLPAFELPVRRKLPTLERDIAVLRKDGFTIPNLSIEPIRFAAIEEALGYLYVAEGATLGGAILARSVRDHLQRDASSGCAYLNGYGEHTGRMWQRFGIAMQQQVANGASAPKIVDGARNVFARAGVTFGPSVSLA